MKIITLNESQFTKLFEDDSDSIFLDGTDTTKRFGAEVSTQAVVTDTIGDEEMSNPINTDKFAVQQSPQQWGAVRGRKSSNTI